MVAGEVEISEDQLPLSDKRIFRLDGLFDLDNHVGVSVNVFDSGENGCSHFDVLFIGESAVFTCRVLNSDGVSVLDEFSYSGWCHADSILVVLDFFWDSNFHFSSILKVYRVILVKTRPNLLKMI